MNSSNEKIGLEALFENQEPTRPSQLAGDQIEDRMKHYGHPRVRYIQIADLWNAILGDKINQPLTPADVLQCMRLVKESRLSQTPDHFDSMVDVCGYADLQFISTYRAPDAVAGIDKEGQPFWKNGFMPGAVVTKSGLSDETLDKMRTAEPGTAIHVTDEELKVLLQTPLSHENLQLGAWVRLKNHDADWCIFGSTPSAGFEPVYHLARINHMEKTECRDATIAEMIAIV